MPIAAIIDAKSINRYLLVFMGKYLPGEVYRLIWRLCRG
jgi:hypothetical protein